MGVFLPGSGSTEFVWLGILMEEDTIRKRMIGHCVTLGNHDGVN